MDRIIIFLTGVLCGVVMMIAGEDDQNYID